MQTKPDTLRAPAPPADKTAAAAPTVDVRELLGDSRELVILHNGERYHLRVTAKGKLILTK